MPCDTRSDMTVGGIIKYVLASLVCIPRNAHAHTAFLLSCSPPLIRNVLMGEKQSFGTFLVI